MLESYVTPILMSYVNRYIKNLKPSDLQLSLWGGDVVLSKLELRLDVLEQELKLPFTFLSGHIHELRIHVPWTKLGSEPVVITINTMECILKLKDGIQVFIPTMAISQFRLFKVCTCLATVFSFLRRLICRSGRGRKLSGDQITLPTTVDYSSVPKQTDVEEWTSWDEEAPTSVKIEGGNGNVAGQQNALEQLEPDYFKDMTPTIRKTQKIIIKKREPLNFGIPDGSTGFSSRLAATQDMPFLHQSPELGDLDTWQENTNAWEEEEDAAWQAEEVLRQQKMADREKRAAEQQRKKMEKEAQRLMKKEQNKIGVKLS